MTLRTLADLSVGQRARIVRVGGDDRAASGDGSSGHPSAESSVPGGLGVVSPAIVVRLHEMGFSEGDIVEVRKVGLLGDPIAVEMDGYLVALRREDAKLIMVDANV